MNKTFKIALSIGICMTVSAIQAHAAVLSDAIVKQKVKAEIMKQFTPPQGAQLEVEVGDLHNQKIITQTNSPRFEVLMNTKYITPKTVVMVKVTENGKPQQAFGVPVSFKILEDVIVTTEDIKIGQPITQFNTEIRKQDVTLNYANVASTGILSKESFAKKNFRANEVVDKRFVEAKPDIMRNSLVGILFQTGDITINIDGEAIEQGNIGEYIKVFNKQYKKFYTGKIINGNTVLVTI